MDVIAVDCGGSNVRVARATGDGVLGDISRASTPERMEDLAAVIAGLVGDPGRARSMGVGVAGLVADGGVTWTPHRHGAAPELAAELHARIGLPVVIDNDANMAALAEARRGAGMGHRMVLTVTVGTGIGAGLVIDGEVERGRGHLGEVGHMIIDPRGPDCVCGLRGCWEAMASGRALDRAARVREGEGAAEGGGADLIAAAAAGDAAARGAVGAVGVALGRGLATLVAVLDPDVIVIGGGVGSIGAMLLDPARGAMMEALPGRAVRRPTPVVPAMFGPEAGLVGAALAAGGVT
ncbi:MAG TPA: ROK family protein [Acidimicrobiia bacterium]|nr:ROK family protein [Acidimicrobiia bacterium]